MKKNLTSMWDKILQITALVLATPGAVIDVYRAMQRAKDFNRNQINPTLH